MKRGVMSVLPIVATGFNASRRILLIYTDICPIFGRRLKATYCGAPQNAARPHLVPTPRGAETGEEDV